MVNELVPLKIIQLVKYCTCNIHLFGAFVGTLLENMTLLPCGDAQRHIIHLIPTLSKYLKISSIFSKSLFTICSYISLVDSLPVKAEVYCRTCQIYHSI